MTEMRTVFPVTSGSVEGWAEQICSGDRRALARAISAVENQSPLAAPLLNALSSKRRHGLVVGLTGAPGVGKSTVLEKLASALRREGLSVGIIAADPTSPFSGGALLGDRLRMQALSTDPQVFIRSMATRGQWGGLAAATGDVATILEAAGFNVILIETVGVGQDEVEIARLADVIVLVLAPGLGDEIQAFKAGVMEIADVLVVNKADLPGSDIMVEQLLAMQATSPSAERERVPILKTVGTTGQGIVELREALAAFQAREASHAGPKKVALKARLTEFAERRARGRPPAVQTGALGQEQTVGSAPPADSFAAAQAASLLDGVSRSALPVGARLDHLGIAVSSLDDAVPIFERLLGAKPSAEELIPDQHVRAVSFFDGSSRIELLEPTSPESPIARFLSKRGPGIHHLALSVSNLAETLQALEREGFRLVDPEPRCGAEGKKIAFLHPTSAAGVLVELMQE